MRIADEDLRGRNIISADGRVIGEIADLFIESDGWRVDALRVKLYRETADQLGTHRSVFRAGEIDIPVRLVQSVGETVVLSVPVEGLRQVMPEEEQPAADP